MDKNKVKNLCQTILDNSYNGTILSDFELTPTYRYDNVLETWVPDSYALFIQLNLLSDSSNTMYKLSEIQSTLEGLLGFECCIDLA
jgi:hypothetical protein